MRGMRFLVALAALLAVVGCSNAGQPFNTPNAQPLCIALGGLNARINDFKALDPATHTAADYQAAAYGIQGAWATLESQVRIYGQAETDNLANAVTALQRAAQALPAGTTPADAATQLSDEIAGVQGALEVIRGKVGCEPFPTPAS